MKYLSGSHMDTWSLLTIVYLLLRALPWCNTILVSDWLLPTRSLSPCKKWLTYILSGAWSVLAKRMLGIDPLRKQTAPDWELVSSIRKREMKPVTKARVWTICFITFVWGNSIFLNKMFCISLKNGIYSGLIYNHVIYICWNHQHTTWAKWYDAT